MLFVVALLAVELDVLDVEVPEDVAFLLPTTVVLELVVEVEVDFTDAEEVDEDEDDELDDFVLPLKTPMNFFI